MRVAFTALSVLWALCSAPRRVDACSCGYSEPTISPSDGATGVPLNALVIVRFAYAGMLTVRLRNATTNELVSITDEIRRPKDSYFGTTFFGTPSTALAPNTTYLVEVDHDQAPQSTATFTTGNAIDQTPPAFSGIVSMRPETMTYPIPDEDGRVCISSCITGGGGHISRIHVDYPELPIDAVHTVLQLYRPGEDVVDEVPVPRWNSHIFGYEICTTHSPVLEPNAEYCGRLVAYDVAGNRAGLDAEVCAVAMTCAPLGAGMDGPLKNCDPSDQCLPVQPVEASSSGCMTTRSSNGLLLLLLAVYLAAEIAATRRKRLRGETA